MANDIPDPNSGLSPDSQAQRNAAPAKQTTGDAASFKDLFSDIAKSQNKTVELTEEIAKLLAQSSKNAKDLEENVEMANLRFSGTLNYAEDLKDAMKMVMEQGRKVATSGIFKAKTVGDARKQVKALIGDFKEVGRRFNSDVTKEVRGLEKVLEDLGDNVDEALGKDKWDKASRGVAQLTRQVQQLGMRFKDIERGALHKQLKNYQAAANHAFGANNPLGNSRVIKMMDKVHSYRQYAANIAEVQRSKRRERDDRVDAGKRKIAQHGVDFEGRNFFRRKSSGFDKLAEKLTTRVDENGQPVKRGVIGSIDQRLTRFALNRAQAAGKLGAGMKPGFFASLLQEGGGSALGGLASKMGGVGGMAMGALGKAVPVMAVLDTMRQMWDKNAEMNKEVEKTLGTGGLFAGSQGAMAMQNLRGNLTPGGFSSIFSPLGVTYDKNLHMAQAIVNSGYSIGNLTGEAPVIGNSDFQRGSFGQMQKSVYVNGRMAGFDETQTVQHMLKLLEKYRVTLEASDTFFYQINKDARSAGLTTTKYIQILDDVNGQFDRMNKSLNDTVMVMRVLSRSGRATADDLKDAMDTITGNTNDGKDLTNDTFFAMQTARSPEAKNALKGMLGQQVTNTTAEAKTALTDFLGEGWNTDNLNSAEGIAALEQQISDKLRSQGEHADTLGGQNAQQVLERLIQARLQRSRGNLIDSNPMGYAATGAILGNGYSNRAVEQLSKLSTIMQYATNGKQGLGSLANEEGAITAFSNPAVSEMAKHFGMDAQTFAKIPQIMRLGSDSLIQGMKTGGINEDDAKEIVDKLGGSMAGFDKAQGDTAAKRLAAYAATDQGSQELAKKLPQLDKTYLRLISSNDVVAQEMDKMSRMMDAQLEESKARSVAVTTRTTADIFADAFTNLFNKVCQLLSDIVSMFDSNKATTDQQNWAKQVFKGEGDNGATMKAAADAVAKARERQAELYRQAESDPALSKEQRDALRAKAAREGEFITAYEKAQQNGGQFGSKHEGERFAELYTEHTGRISQALYAAPQEDKEEIVARRLRNMGGQSTGKGMFRIYDDAAHSNGNWEELQEAAKGMSITLDPTKKTDNQGRVYYEIKNNFYSTESVTSAPPTAGATAGNHTETKNATNSAPEIRRPADLK